MGKLQAVVAEDFESVIFFKHSYGDYIQAWFENDPELNGHVFKINNQVFMTPDGEITTSKYIKNRFADFFKKSIDKCEAVPLDTQRAIYKEAMEYIKLKHSGVIAQVFKGHNQGYAGMTVTARKDNPSIFIDMHGN